MIKFRRPGEASLTLNIGSSPDPDLESIQFTVPKFGPRCW